MNIDHLHKTNDLLIDLFEKIITPKGEFIIKGFIEFEGIKKDEIDNIIESDCHLLQELEITKYELFILYLVILPTYYKNCYKHIRYLQKKDEDYFNIMGGTTKKNGIFYPTKETIIFIIAGNNISKKIGADTFLNHNNALFSKSYIQSVYSDSNDPLSSVIYYPSEEVLAIMRGEVFTPSYSTNFPAKEINTKMDWEDLVLPYDTHESLRELSLWMNHKSAFINYDNIQKRIKPGYRTLFYGPPGTGKTLTASLIGKRFNAPVYRIDLSMIVSKWVGETEKNLQTLFNMAENKNWILFFDEADSLFGKRTQTSSSNDRYANQEVSYLLQRIEDYPGLIILASNLKSNMDSAFMRRFQSTVLFPMPNEEMRLELWKKSFPKDFELDPEIDFRKIAKKYEIAGGAITNIIRYCFLCALERGNNTIMYDDLEYAIIREFRKSGKIAS